ncbi:MAG: nucleotidyl transferase AbiEii/AbiGii toxin family protein [Anaerolineales bacterium]
MLTRDQVRRLAQRHGIGMQVQERDYVQHLLLWQLYSQTQELIFKGGTALRVVYGGNRYSEDLDFNASAEPPLLQALWEKVVRRLADFGLAAEMRNTWISEVGFSFDVSFQGPLYDGRERSKGKIRIDINRRPEEVETQRELVTCEYDDVRPFVVTVLTPEHLFAEKVRALLVRNKPRDLYDIWLLLRRGVQAERSLIERKLSLYGLTWAHAALEEALEHAGADWERDLRPLLPQFVTFEMVRREVLQML